MKTRDIISGRENENSKCHNYDNVLILTSILLEGMDPSFCKASFKSPLPLMAGSLCTPSAATKIVI
jgi:hypothetical protein